ncbi:MAG: hypothetical protein EZS28_054489, partial [Streblomastix strix]
PSPGAGAYKPPDKMPDALEDPIYSMPKGERNTGMINTTNYKGQFKDPQNITLLSTSTAPVIPAFSKDDRVKHFVTHTPSLGVGAYKPSEMPPSAPEDPKYSMPKGSRNTGMINITNYNGQNKSNKLQLNIMN